MMADSNLNLNVDANVVDKPSWERAHQMLVGLARTRAGLDLEEGKWLLAASREQGGGAICITCAPAKQEASTNLTTS